MAANSHKEEKAKSEKGHDFSSNMNPILLIYSYFTTPQVHSLDTQYPTMGIKLKINFQKAGV